MELLRFIVDTQLSRTWTTSQTTYNKKASIRWQDSAPRISRVHLFVIIYN